MRPKNLKTRIFLDSGDPAETKAVVKLLGFLDGQTTNPSLISKNPETKNKKFSEEEVYDFYKQVVREIAEIIPDGSISIEVYADKHTTTDEMLDQGREFFSWIAGAHIKFPTNAAGLAVAERAVKEGLRVNLTLCFSIAQAAAVYAATRGAARGQVYVSPFIGRLDDIGENGMDLIANVLKMYEAGDGHVEVLTASVRSLNHLLYALSLGSDILTAPFGALKEWAEKGLEIPGPDFEYQAAGLKPIAYQELNLSQPWQSFNISHPLTDKGMEKFSADWKSLITPT